MAPSTTAASSAGPKSWNRCYWTTSESIFANSNEHMFCEPVGRFWHCYRLFSHNVVTMETSAIGWPPWLITFWYLLISEQLYMLMHEAMTWFLQIQRYQNGVNQGGHPIALVSMATTLCETRLYRSGLTHGRKTTAAKENSCERKQLKKKSLSRWHAWRAWKAHQTIQKV